MRLSGMTTLSFVGKGRKCSTVVSSSKKGTTDERLVQDCLEHNDFHVEAAVEQLKKHRLRIGMSEELSGRGHLPLSTGYHL